MSSTRRKILQSVAIAGLGLAGYSMHRGVRLPTLHWGPSELKNRFKISANVKARGSDLIATSTQAGQDASFRAFAPEPTLNIDFSSSSEITVGINNIASDARLRNPAAGTSVTEEIDGINRVLKVRGKAQQSSELSWELPKLKQYSFASIGDTGGGHELAWCLQRAHALGARFLLHLGDFNYQPGDYQRSIDLFKNSAIPVYVSIGNHDFHTRGAIYGNFLNEIGPLNNSFSIGQTRYVNIDTAANILPYGAGQRGDIVSGLAKDSRFVDTVAFTHRPLHDPLTDSDHDLGSEGERDWLVNHLKQAKVKTLLSGHIHIYDRSDFNGIDNIIAGQGLGHQDLIVDDISHSKMIIGSVDAQGRVSYETASLSMPMEMHCHPRTSPVKESLTSPERVELIQRINLQCEQNS